MPLTPEEKQARRERWEAERAAERQRQAAELAAELARRELYPLWLRDWAKQYYKIESSQELADLVNWIVVILFVCNFQLSGKLTIKRIHSMLKRHPEVKNPAFTAERFYMRLGQLLTAKELIDKRRPNVGYVIRPGALQFFQVLQARN